MSGNNDPSTGIMADTPTTQTTQHGSEPQQGVDRRAFNQFDVQFLAFANKWLFMQRPRSSDEHLSGKEKARYIVRAIVEAFRQGPAYLFDRLFIPAITIMMGILHIGQCPMDERIIILLIADGCLNALACLLFGAEDLLVKKYDTVPRNFICNLKSTIEMILFLMFCINAFWIYGNYYNVQMDSPASLQYCSRSIYLFAFAWTTLWSISYFLIILTSIYKTWLDGKRIQRM